jgi:2-hydroxy-6-oxonona-2,4-dienedioate hydrolase
MFRAFVLLMWLVLPVGPAAVAQAGATTPADVVPHDGAIAGLKPKFVDVNGVRTRYYEAGSGEPMLLVHGDGFSGYASANVWSKNIAGLSQRFHVYAIDKVGSGMTGNPLHDSDYNLQGEIEHAHQFIKTMKLDKVHLVGQSRGGGLVFFLAVAHPEIVRTLVVIDSLTAAPKGPHTRHDAIGKCPKHPHWAEWECRLKAVSYKPDVFDDEFFQAARAMADTPKAHQTVDKRKAGAGQPRRKHFNSWKESLLDHIKAKPVLMMPTLIYWGYDDPSAVLARGLALYDLVAVQNPKVRMSIVNKAGHYHFREYPDEFNANITDFIDFWERQQSK